MSEIAIIKKRILQYLDSKGVSKYECYQRTGITNGVFSKKEGLSEENLLRFVSYYIDINPDWLITGQGEMLRNTIPVEFTQAVLSPPNDDIITLLKEQLKESREKIEKQAEEIGFLKSQLREVKPDLDDGLSPHSPSLSYSRDVHSEPVPL